MAVTPARCSVIVPTLGRSPHLAECLRALARCGPDELLVVVPAGLDPASLLDAEDRRLVHRFVEVDRPGFAAANNAGFAVARGRFVATVNDDAVVDGGWLAALLETLESEPATVAVQGLNLDLDGARIDGWGLGWNRFLQAVQLGHGLDLESAPAPAPDEADARPEIFGVSATAAVYRRSALQSAAFDGHEIFDEELFAYYEDVDLAIRLRSAGGRSRCVPAARARHAGSVSGKRLPFGGAQLIHGNRHLVLARALGRSFWTRWPRIAVRDAVDLVRALSRGDLPRAAGIVASAGRILRRLPAYARTGPPSVELEPWIWS